MKKINVSAIGLLLCLSVLAQEGQWYPVKVEIKANNTPGDVKALHKHKNKLYIGGTFDTVGSIYTLRHAIYDGAKWQGVSTENIGSVKDIIVYKNDLFSGGSFLKGTNNIGVLKYDSVTMTWDSIGANGPPTAKVLGVYLSALYAGGKFSSTSTVSRNIGKWDGTQWQKIGNVGTTTSSNEVNALKAGNIRGKEELFVGGDFLKASNACQECKNLAVWDDSTWSHIDTVWDKIIALYIDTINKELYISGSFTQVEALSTWFLAKWNGKEWSGFGNDLDCSAQRQGLITYHGELYLGGCITKAGNNSVRYIARWNGREWNDVGGGVNADVVTFAKYQDTLYVGGFFRTVGTNNDTSLGLAKWYTPPCAYLDAGIETLTFNPNNSTLTLTDSSAGLWIDTKQWDFDDGTIITGDTATYQYTQGGTYTVEYTVQFTYPNGTVCRDTATRTFTVTGTEDLKKSEVNELNIIPNPAEDQITIELSFKEMPENTELVITNSNGQQVQVFGNLQKAQHLQVSTTGWSDGVYFVTLKKNGKTIRTEKLILQE